MTDCIAAISFGLFYFVLVEGGSGCSANDGSNTVAVTMTD